MRFSKTLNTAVTALARNKLRALLTALGIIIGIASVIVMIEIGQGSSKAIQTTIASMGANNIIIMSGTAASGGVSYGAGTTLTLTADDSEAISKGATALKNAAPIVRSRVQVIYRSKNWVPQYIYGTTPAFLDVRDWNSLTEGSMFQDRDVRNGNKVCVIGQTLVRELFEGESPIGKEIRLQNVALKVVGVLASKGANMMGMDQDDIVIAPWTVVKYRISGSSTNSSSSSSSSQSSSSGSSTSAQNSSAEIYPAAQVDLYPPASTGDAFMIKRFANIDQITAAAGSAEDVPIAIDQITGILRERHRIRQGEPDDFTIRDMTEMASALSSTSSLMTKLLLGVACISLIVGGVGIMNIMLVSVTERTREIGLRMAVGAREKDILQQFLVEAVVLCLAGGIAGIVLGRTLSSLITLLLKWPTETSLPAIITAFMVSVSVGLVFGYYPAAKASKLDPIEALRYE